MSDLPGIGEAHAALTAGRAAVVAHRSPLPYGVIATAPQAINVAKGRPPEQEVAYWLREDAVWSELAPTFDLRSAALAMAYNLLRREMVTLLLPLRANASPPAWTTPAIRDGHALFFGALWSPLQPLQTGFPQLYISSANRAGHAPATTATEARAMFGPDVPLVDGDALRDPQRPHGSTTMLRIADDGELTLVRHGIQDSTHHRDPAAYLTWLRTTRPA